MRAIRFRGWDGGKWLYGDLLCSKPGDPLYYIRFTDEDGDTVAHAVDPRTIGQYTDLNDKHGAEIYEGDILRYAPANDYGEPSKDTYEVVWGRHGFIALWLQHLPKPIESNGLDDCDQDMEVIGNLYESPDLLTKEVL